MSEYIKKSELFDKTVRRNSIWNGTTNAEGKGLEEIVNDLPTYSFSNSAENKGDLISRQAVEKLIWEHLRKETDENIAFYEHFLELPSIENKGEWISEYDEDGKTGWYECSCCHSERAFNTNFCPDCGADMREPKPKLGNSMLVGKPSLLNRIIPIGAESEETE